MNGISLSPEPIKLRRVMNTETPSFLKCSYLSQNYHPL
jgi:hypothetical protein